MYKLLIIVTFLCFSTNFAHADKYDHIEFLKGKISTQDDLNSYTAEELHQLIGYQVTSITRSYFPISQWISLVEGLSLSALIQLLKYDYSHNGFSEIGKNLLLAQKRTGSALRLESVIKGLEFNPHGGDERKFNGDNKKNIRKTALEIIGWSQRGNFSAMDLQQRRKSPSFFKGYLDNYQIIADDQFLAVSADNHLKLQKASYLVSAHKSSLSEALIMYSQKDNVSLLANFSVDHQNIDYSLKLIQEQLEKRNFKLENFQVTIVQSPQSKNERLEWEVRSWVSYNRLKAPLKTLTKKMNGNVVIKAETGRILLDKQSSLIRLNSVMNSELVEMNNYDMRLHTNMISVGDVDFVVVAPAKLGVGDIHDYKIRRLKSFFVSVEGAESASILLSSLDRMTVGQLADLLRLFSQSTQDYNSILKKVANLDVKILTELLNSQLKEDIQRSLILYIERTNFRAWLDIIKESLDYDITNTGNTALSFLGVLPINRVSYTIEQLKGSDVGLKEIYRDKKTGSSARNLYELLKLRFDEVGDFVSSGKQTSTSKIKNVGIARVKQTERVVFEIKPHWMSFVSLLQAQQSRLQAFNLEENTILIAIEGKFGRYAHQLRLGEEEDRELVARVNSFLKKVKRFEVSLGAKERGSQIQRSLGSSQLQGRVHFVLVGLSKGSQAVSRQTNTVKQLVATFEGLRYTHQSIVAQPTGAQLLIGRDNFDAKTGMPFSLSTKVSTTSSVVNTLLGYIKGENIPNYIRAREVKPAYEPINERFEDALLCEASLGKNSSQPVVGEAGEDGGGE